MEEKKNANSHSLLLEERRYGRITGVQEVCSFNENEIIMLSEAGKILLKGDQLHVKSLDLERGAAEIEGKVSSFSYISKTIPKKQESFWKRMFR